MDSIVAVNVGLPRDVAWEGRVVRTAIWKRPVTGRVMARRLNIDGDGQGDLAGHGGEHRAVMVYQLDSYRHWEIELQRKDFEHGQFGENLTVDGLRDSDVCIGDRYRIGGALFEVTQPRVTCYRVGMRMGNPLMPSLLVSHRRPGFYFRVIEEGEIGAGDEIIKVADGPERMTVAAIDALLYLPGHPKDQLEQALRVPALSAGWKGSFASLLRAETEAKPMAHAGLSPWPGFRSLRVASIQRECVNVLSFVLETEDKTPLPAPLPGQYLVFKLRMANGDATVMRSYSLSGPPEAGTYRVTVKRANGQGSHYFHDAIAAGTELQVSAPRGSFTLAEDDGPVVLLSAGIGATPVLAMLHALASSGQKQRQIWWCYGARNRSEHPFMEETRALLGRLPGAIALTVYSSPAADDRLGEHYDLRGHLDVAALQRLNIPQAANFYLCGPTGFLSGLRAELKAWGVADARVHSENFGTEASLTPGITASFATQPHLPSGIPGSGPKVSFTRSGLSVPWDSKFASLLEFAEACDVPVRWSCRVGVCHNCETGLIGGNISYSPEPLERPAAGNVLICCATPKAEIELDL
jgi:ferredoxin-NADP reductase/MOSC domain-containing protein YiiM/ferredoxin